MGRRAVRVVVLVGAMLACLAPAAQAAFPGENGKIAYSHACDIWTVEPDGTGATQLTESGTECDIQPAWSPDGERIAFVRGTPGGNVSTYAMYIMDADGTDLHAVRPRAFGPAWSPDGTRIAFTEGGLLETMAADGTDVQRIDTTFGPFSSVSHGPPTSWSPDGPELVSGGSWGSTSIGGCRITIATGVADCEDSGGDKSYEDWSPNSRWILVGTCCAQPGIYYFGEGDFVELTAGGAFEGLDGNAAWSPDGTTIVFRRDPHFGDPDPPEMFLVDAADGGNLRPLGGPHVGIHPDWQPIPVNAYPRPKGASPQRLSLVPAYEPCMAPNRTHGAPLAFPSCSPPAKVSRQLTIGTPDANGQPAKSVSHVRINPVAGLPSTPADEADVRLRGTINDVRLASDLSDYTGDLELRLTVQITDKDNTPHPGGPGPATVQQFSHFHPFPCAATGDTTVGATCAFDTTVEALVPGAVKELQRAIWALDQVQVHDGAGDPFLRQGVFVP